VKREAFRQVMFLRDANSDKGSGGGGGAQAEGQGDPPDKNDAPSWDDYYGGLDATSKTLVDGRLSSLESVLKEERENKRRLEKSIKDLGAKAEKGSDLEKSIDELRTQLEEANRRSAFFEGAAKQGVTSARLAYLAAKEAQAFDNSGNVNWERLKEAHPELFKAEPKPGGQKDAGAGGGSNTSSDINAAIRRAAGRS